MSSEAELAIIRKAFAKQITMKAGVKDPRFVLALSTSRREAFLGPGPWQLMRPPHGYKSTPDADPLYLYQDSLVGIIPEKTLINGEPSFLVYLLSLGKPQPGEHAVHIGAGVGYYISLLCTLVKPGGKVTAIEYESELAARAEQNLSEFGNATVIAGDGATAEFDEADIIYVNAGCVGPVDAWLDRLKDGGRLILPLTAKVMNDGLPITYGAIFVIERSGDQFFAEKVSSTAIYPFIGQRDEDANQALAAAFQNGGFERITRLYRHTDIDDDQVWLKGDNWTLAFS